jgi:hypothetical protein
MLKFDVGAHLTKPSIDSAKVIVMVRSSLGHPFQARL